MREYSSPLAVDLPKSGNLTDDVVANGVDHPDEVCFSRRRPAGWADVTAAEFLAEVRGVAKGLMAAGVAEGDRVALLSKTRYEWTLIDYAIWFAGAVTVPIYETSSSEQVEWILSDSGATAIIVESPTHAARVAEVQDGVSHLENVWVLDDGAVEALVELGSSVSDVRLEERRKVAGPDSAATIIYTSGTTGRPKGCVLTHGNFMFELGVAVDELHELFEVEDASTLLFLPLAHVFARIIQIGAVKARVRLGHSSGAKELLNDLATFQPTFILAVPRVFEKVFNTASQRAAADGRGKVFDAAANTADRLQPSPGHRPARHRPSRPALRLRQARLLESFAKPWEATAATRSPAAPLSASGSATSTAASAWSCSRGTDSRRAQLPSRLTGHRLSRSARWDAHCPAQRSASPTTASCSCAVARCSPDTGTTPRRPRKS